VLAEAAVHMEVDNPLQGKVKGFATQPLEAEPHINSIHGGSTSCAASGAGYDFQPLL
jgi:hypothetical protein